MRKLFQLLRRWVSRIAIGLFLSQLLTALVLGIFAELRKHRRTQQEFPHEPASTVTADRDELTIYTFGEDLYADMIEAIDQAKHTIYFGTYIWKADEVGQRFKDALTRAAKRGVSVYVVFDGFGNFLVSRRFLRFDPLIHTMRHPTLPVPWSPRHWGRDHRKLLVVDHEVGFIGGFNISSDYAKYWRDTHARVVGPSVAELENAYADFWNQWRKRRLPQLGPSSPRLWFNRLRVVRNAPRVQVYPIRNMYLEAINRAQERIWLTHAYFIPDEDLVAALAEAAKRGVDVRVIVPQRSNHVVADWLSRGFYTSLLRQGIRLFLYRDAMVHAKTATIDGVWATIGTANLDRLSLAGNYEVNLEILNETVSKELEDIFTFDLANAEEVTLPEWLQRSLLTKATEALLSPLRPLF
ncbi:MAG: cardiolipin synthase B [Propionibacterium sp.]|nr:MAG: cardiolipin synthase B [Propionibacterium sp.]